MGKALSGGTLTAGFAGTSIKDQQVWQGNDIDIRRRQLDASVLLIKALGRGWDTSELPQGLTVKRAA